MSTKHMKRQRKNLLRKHKLKQDVALHHLIEKDS